LTVDGVASLRLEARPDTELPTLLVQHLAGFSPQMGREATYRALGTTGVTVAELQEQPDGPARLAAAVASVLEPLQTHVFEPTVYWSSGEPVAFAAIRLHYLQGLDVEAAREAVLAVARRALRRRLSMAPGWVARALRERTAQIIAALYDDDPTWLDSRIRDWRLLKRRAADAKAPQWLRLLVATPRFETDPLSLPIQYAAQHLQQLDALPRHIGLSATPQLQLALPAQALAA
jgi:predicted DNA-binding protein (UPF0251 family)